MDDLIVAPPEDGVVVITLNRPDQLNAVTMAMQERLDAALTELEGDEAVRCLVLAGAGDRAFSAGYDVRELAAWSADELELALSRRERFVWHVAATPLPIVAVVDGITYGVGAIMASSVDVRVGGPATVWRFTAGEHGGANATWSLPSLVGRGRAAELLMTARPVDAEEALRIGLLNRLADDPLAAGLETARAIAANPRAGTRAIKRLLREHAGASIAQRFEAENVVMRTELKPGPVGELYADFLGDDG